MTADDPMWDELFHGVAWLAYIDQAQQERTWPDCEATRRRAFAYYEAELAIKNGRPRQPPASPLDDLAKANRPGQKASCPY